MNSFDKLFIGNQIDKDFVLKVDKFFLILFYLHIPIMTFFIPAVKGLILTGLISSLFLTFTATISYAYFREKFYHRYLNGIILMSFSVSIISLSLGKIEHHFHIFVFLAVLVLYQDWKVLIPPTILIAFHHVSFAYCQVYNIESSLWPLKVFQYEMSWNTVTLHIGYVILEVGLLIYISEILKNNYLINKELSENLEEKVKERTSSFEKKSMELIIELDSKEKLQTTIIAQEKLASLGSLTAGIAHELKNPLNILKNSCLVMEMFARDYPDLKEIELAVKNGTDKAKYIDEDYQDAINSLHIISKNILRTEDIVHKMLGQIQSDDAIEENAKVDLNELLLDTFHLSLNKIKSKKDFYIYSEAKLIPLTRIFYGQQKNLRRALVNVFDNSYYFVKKKKLLDIADYAPTITLTTELTSDNAEIKIIIFDNGVGIRQTDLQKVCEPFFTKKSGTDGTGLGMYIANDIIHSHGGRISYESELDQWCRCIIILPLEGDRDELKQ